MKESRRKEMAALIAERGSATMEQLRDEFNVSMNTIRSDVASLLEAGAIEKVYGGVRALPGQEVPLFTQREGFHSEAKRKIASAAASLIREGDLLYIDSGTTTARIFDFLDPSLHVTVITGNLSVVSKVYGMPNIELIVLPGSMNRRTNSVADISTTEFLSRYHFTKAFMGASGISQEGELNVSTYIEYELKKMAVCQSREAFLLADSSKFDGIGLMIYASADDMSGIITDSLCPGYFIELCAGKGTKLIIAD